MVNNKFRWLLLALTGLIVTSCSEDYRFRYSSRMYGDKESFGHELMSLLDCYIRDYNKFPAKAEDLMIYIDRMGKDSRLKYHDGSYIYDNQYRYFENNKNKLIFATDSLVCIYYGKIRDRNLLISIVPKKPCYNIKSAGVNFFDEEGYYLRLDSFTANSVKNRLWREYIVHFKESHNMKADSLLYPMTILEYTSRGLTDLCKEEELELGRSLFLQNVFNFLDSVAHANNLSRITFPVLLSKGSD